MSEGTISWSCTCKLVPSGYYAFVGPCVHDLLTDALARIAELEAALAYTATCSCGCHVQVNAALAKPKPSGET